MCVCPSVLPFTDTQWPCGDNKAHYTGDPNPISYVYPHFMGMHAHINTHTDIGMEKNLHTCRWTPMYGYTDTPTWTFIYWATCCCVVQQALKDAEAHCICSFVHHEKKISINKNTIRSLKAPHMLSNLTWDVSNRIIYIPVTSLGVMHMFMNKLLKQCYSKDELHSWPL